MPKTPDTLTVWLESWATQLETRVDPAVVAQQIRAALTVARATPQVTS